jgi:hypothetical protein
MKRFSFLAALFGFGASAKAQEYGSLKDFKLEVRYCPPQWTVKEREDCGKPLNNECPVCGTMAKPYERKMIQHGSGINCRPSYPYSILEVCDRDEEFESLPIQDCIRCVHCNAAFWRDAE